MATPSPLRPIARRALAAQSDDRLVRLVREGHAPAFEEMVRRYRGPLVGFAAAIVSADGAEDVVQSSLAKAHDALLADSREINLRPWLFAIVRNGALNAIRGEPRVDELREATAVSANPSEIAEQRDDLDRIVVAMCALPEAQRQALVKRELEGVGHGEIAAQLGTTATAVRGLIFRARVGLRDAVGALVPLPILRTLLTDGTALGLAGGGAGAGAAAMLGGGTAVKGGGAIAAAVVALGTGIAIDQGRDGTPQRDADRAAVARQESDSTPGAPDSPAATVGAESTGEPSGSGTPGGGEGPGGNASPDDDRAEGFGGEPSEGAEPEGEGEREPEDDDRSDDEDDRDDESTPDDDVDNSGPGGGGGPGHGGSGPSEPDDDSGDEDSSNSGPGSGDDDNSGSGRPPEPLEPEDPPEPEDDEGGPGGGAEPDEDNSGSGGGGSGSGSDDD